MRCFYTLHIVSSLVLSGPAINVRDDTRTAREGSLSIEWLCGINSHKLRGPGFASGAIWPTSNVQYSEIGT